MLVTPYAGVWIEIGERRGNHSSYIVTPYAGVWIEIVNNSRLVRQLNVTPYAGVWIEILVILISFPLHLVTPYAGVWIEIPFANVEKQDIKTSLPTRECGLKYHVFGQPFCTVRHSLRGSVD